MHGLVSQGKKEKCLSTLYGFYDMNRCAVFCILGKGPGKFRHNGSYKSRKEQSEGCLQAHLIGQAWVMGQVIKRILKLLISIVFRGVEKLKALFRRGKKPGTYVVLLYHDVAAKYCPRFSAQMDMLSQIATPVAIDSIFRLQRGMHHVAVTFDDGFAFTLDTVLPILIQKAIPATFFIPTAYCGKEAAWIPDLERRRRVGRIISVDGLRLFSANNFVTIGSHGINHRRMTGMKNNEAEEELAGSKKRLEDITGKEVKIYSFPFGDYNDSHVALARELGYRRLFTIHPTLAAGTDDEFVFGRVQVEPTDWPLEFRLKLLGAYRWMMVASSVKKRSMKLFAKDKHAKIKYTME
jgi:peptidoglycan/xylan/chitin deacetylase (PgdA/CDA1 family)